MDLILFLEIYSGAPKHLLNLRKNNYSEQNLAENLFHLQRLQEDLHMKFMEIVLGVNSKATNFAVRSELGRFPLHIKIYTAMLIL